MRIDFDNDGNPIPDWDKSKENGEDVKTSEGAAGALRNATPEPISAIVVERMFKQEKSNTTK
jgi:hypothetical protein